MDTMLGDLLLNENPGITAPGRPREAENW